MSSPTLHIQFSDSSSNELSLFPHDNPEAAIILLFPALGVRASFYKGFAQALSDQGFHVVTADWRGMGKSSIRPSRAVDFGYKELVADLGEMISAVKQHFPESKGFFLMGHSLGGQIESMFISKQSGQIDGLILIASCMVYHTGWKEIGGSWRIKLICRLFPFIARIVGHFPGKAIGFGGREAKTVMRDWGYNGLTGSYAPKGDDFDYDAALAQTTFPILAMSMQGDNFAPKAAVENLYRKFHSDSPVRHLHISSEEADTPKLNHYNWAKHPDYFVKQVKEWTLEST